ncbi:MAG: ABC transporter substrate-binding protein [Candidatus Limnocylindrales bacterium]
MATPRTHAAPRAVLVGLTALAVLACTSAVPSGSPSPAATPSLTPDPAATTLRIGLEADPSGFLVPTPDPATQLVDRFLQAGLYRLGPDLAPEPDLAVGGPSIKAKGLTWSIALEPDRHFSDGTTVTSADVLRTYQLALSPACPFGDRCEIAANGLAKVSAPDPDHVVFSLRRTWAPLLTELLAQLPILPAAALDASLGRLVSGASGLDVVALNDLLGRIETATNQDECFGAQPPLGCELATYVPFLETMLERANLPLPEATSYLDALGKRDEERYGAALLERVKALGRTLAATGIDRLAAALPLLDLQTAPVGAGPFRLVRYQPGVALELVRWGPSPGADAPREVRFEVLPDPAAAATALQAGALDWLPDVSADLAAGLGSASDVRVGARPSNTLHLLTFNVRAGHPYADAVARQAFAACLDVPGLWSDATHGAGLPASTLLPPGSWAASANPAQPARDAAAARAALEAAGWQRGSDGIYARGALRLASTIYVRPGRADLLGFASAAATQLRACGIALEVQAVNLSGQALLVQLEYPNTFETFLGTQASGNDPDEDLGRLGSSRITSAAHPGDANFGGWRDDLTDRLLAQGAAATDAAARRTTYLELEAYLAHEAPVLPLAWEPAYAGVATRLTLAGRPVDPGRAGYDRNVLEWRLTGS